MYEVQIVRRSSGNVCIPVALSFDPGLVNLVASRILRQRKRAIFKDELLQELSTRETAELENIVETTDDE